MNLLSGIGPGRLGPFAWEHEPERWEALSGGGLRVHAPARADYFRDQGEILSNVVDCHPSGGPRKLAPLSRPRNGQKK
jgi:hypothetical protein